MWTIPKLAKAKGFAVNTIAQFIESGELRAINVSLGDERSRWRITEEDWQEFCESRANRPPRARRKPVKRRKPTITKDYFAEVEG